MAWQAITDDIKNGEPVLLKFKTTSLVSHDSNRWLGVVFVGRNSLDESRYDYGWQFAAPIGYGGIPDEDLEGWQPIPT